MGGKRKKSNNGPIKKESKYKIPTRFDCPLCDSKATIVVKIFRATSDATVRCRNCGAGGTKRWSVLRLEKPVDVFFRFHEALIQKDQQDLQRVEMSREAQQARLSGTGLLDGQPLPGAAAATFLPADHGAVEDVEGGIDGPQHGGAALVGKDESWIPGATRQRTSGAISAPAPRQVRSLGELQRKLAMAASTPAPVAYAGRVAGDDDFSAEAEGAAAHYFAPRQEVHSGQDDDDEYDQLFQ